MPKKYNFRAILDQRFISQIHGPEIYKEFLDIFPLETLTNYKTFNDNFNSFQIIPEFNNNLLLTGYFQYEDHFREFREEIIQIFNQKFDKLDQLHNLNSSDKSDNYDKLNKINNLNKSNNFDKLTFQNTSYNIIHVRRGDYLKLQNIFNILDMNYYRLSEKYLNQDLPKLIISEDVQFCQENFQNSPIYHQSDIEDFNMIRKCQNTIIIANSTFSWWAAYLSQAKTVIFPFDWFNNNYNGFEHYNITRKSWRCVTTKTYQELESFILKHFEKHLNKNNENIFNLLEFLLEEEPTNNKLKNLINLKVNKMDEDTFKTLRINILNKLTSPLSKKDLKNIINTLPLALFDDLEFANFILKICSEKLISVKLKIREKLTQVLGLIKIDLTKITCYIITRDSRKAELLKRFQAKNINPIFINGVQAANGAFGCGLSHINLLHNILKGFESEESKEENFNEIINKEENFNEKNSSKNSSKNNSFQPFAIFEDDIGFTKDFKDIFELPQLTDCLYLGNSIWGKPKNYSLTGQIHINCSRDLNGYIKINNMLATHAILYLNQNYARKVLKAMKNILEMNIAIDIATASLQEYHNVLTFEHPPTVQDITIGGQKDTYHSLTRFL